MDEIKRRKKVSTWGQKKGNHSLAHWSGLLVGFCRLGGRLERASTLKRLGFGGFVGRDRERCCGGALQALIIAFFVCGRTEGVFFSRFLGFFFVGGLRLLLDRDLGSQAWI